VNKYWYFFATLPGLKFGTAPPFSSDEFLALCRNHLSPDDYVIVEGAASLSLEKGKARASGSALLQQYVSWDRSMRNELSRLRARRLGTNEEASVRDTDLSGDGSRVASNIFSIEDPLQAELFLERQRWNAVESMAAGSDFQVDSIVAYRIKLDIAIRIDTFISETGRRNYMNLYDEILSERSMGDNV
jgi:hypothetical protein